MKGFGTFLLLVIIVIVALAVLIWTGVYNVAATDPHWGITSLVLEAVRERSVEVHSQGVTAPPLDVKSAEIGIPFYHNTCRLCHGAPGYRPDDFARGLYPSPPNLTTGEAQREMNAGEIFWIVKNGLKMTGMPAFGPTRDDRSLWGVVAFLMHLPKLKPEDYQAMVGGNGPK